MTNTYDEYITKAAGRQAPDRHPATGTPASRNSSTDGPSSWVSGGAIYGSDHCECPGTEPPRAQGRRRVRARCGRRPGRARRRPYRQARQAWAERQGRYRRAATWAAGSSSRSRIARGSTSQAGSPKPTPNAATTTPSPGSSAQAQRQGRSALDSYVTMTLRDLVALLTGRGHDQPPRRPDRPHPTHRPHAQHRPVTTTAMAAANHLPVVTVARPHRNRPLRHRLHRLP